MTGSLLVIGSTNLDLVVGVARHPAPGETVLGDDLARWGGGKGANQALAAALQGATVRFVTAVGSDDDAELALRTLRAEGVDLGNVIRSGAPTGLAVIAVDEHGENTIIVIPGANATMTPEQAERAVATMHEDDLLLLQGELPRATTEAAARAAAASGRRVVLNVAPWSPLDTDVLASADPLILNEHEATAALAALGLAADVHPADAAGALRDAGVRSVVVTLGAEGAIVADADTVRRVPSPVVDAVDTTGAGDAFSGALAASLLAGDELTTAVTHAVRVAAFAVRTPGAQPSYPRATDVLP